MNPILRKNGFFVMNEYEAYRHDYFKKNFIVIRVGLHG